MLLHLLAIFELHLSAISRVQLQALPLIAYQKILDILQILLLRLRVIVLLYLLYSVDDPVILEQLIPENATLVLLLCVVQVPGGEAQQIEQVHSLVGAENALNFDAPCHFEFAIFSVQKDYVAVKVELVAGLRHDVMEVLAFLDGLPIVYGSILCAVGVVRVKNAWNDRLGNNSPALIVDEAGVEHAQPRNLQLVEDLEISEVAVGSRDSGSRVRAALLLQ